MGKTTNLGLHTTASDETSKTFLEYRTELSGTGADSNMNIIDKAYGEMDAKIDANKQTETEKFSTLDSTVSGIQSGLSQEVTARTSGDQLLNARIDELVAPSGEAPSAAEVQDARVGVDATTYASLGEAIRGQVGNLKSDINDNNQELGFAVKNFNKVAGSAHSSTIDKLDVTIKSGQKFYVTVSQIGSDNEFAFQLMGWLNGVSSRITGFDQTTSDVRKSITAISDFDQLSVYVGNDQYSGSAEMTLLFESEESKLIKIETIESDISILENSTKKIDTEIYGLGYSYADVGSGYYNSLGNKTNNRDYSYGFADVSGTSSVEIDTSGITSQCIINVCDADKGFLRNVVNWGNPNKYTVQLGSGEAVICVSTKTKDFDLVTVRDSISVEKSILYKLDDVTDEVTQISRKVGDIIIPVLRNGSAGNSGNADSISTQYIYPIDFTKEKIVVEYLGDASLANQYAWAYCAFAGATDGMTSSSAYADASITKRNYNSGATERLTVPKFELPTVNVVNSDHIMFYLFRYNNGTPVPLRIATDQYNFRITYKEKDGEQSPRDIDLAETKHDLLFAKHAKNSTGPLLTLLHFSDLHADTVALARIMKDSEEIGCDDAICTGDIAGNAAAQITSWWDESVLTCIGNHDTASYNSTDGYNWVALNMENRDAYYITPFKNNWGSVVHTSGKSYYYKDYADAKVRLIVMDAMLYSIYESDAALGTAQTAWLNSLLSGAISNNLHVLIAIHAPHGGATAKECSFSRYVETTMPTYNDCNTPQVIVDAVAAAIESGLHFVGYLVGHTHQDNVWDAEGDGKQLMYCITCAAVSNVNQWKNSDQFRDAENDAYNIVVIDTTNTLVKLIRGGGANMDDHMRTRKAICFNYSTGEKVGEVL